MTIFKSFIGAKDMKLWDGRTRTFDRLTSTGGTLTQNKIGHFVDALEVYGDGTAYTDSTISLACSMTDGIVMLQPGTWDITDNLTIPATTELYVPKGAYLSIAAGKTLTINGTFPAGPYRVFTGSGAVMFGSESVKEIYPEWWGGKADGATDSSIAFQASILASASGGTDGHGIPIKLQAGIYKANFAIAALSNIAIIGAGARATFIKPAMNNPVITLDSTTGPMQYITVKDIGLDNSSSGWTNDGILITGTNINDYISLERMFIYKFGSGMHITGRTILSHFDKLLIQSSTGNGIHIEGNSNSMVFNANSFTRVASSGSTGHGMYIKDTGPVGTAGWLANSWDSSCDFEGNGGSGIRVDGGNGGLSGGGGVYNSYIENNIDRGVYITGTLAIGFSVKNNLIWGSMSGIDYDNRAVLTNGEIIANRFSGKVHIETVHDLSLIHFLANYGGTPEFVKDGFGHDHVLIGSPTTYKHGKAQITLSENAVTSLAITGSPLQYINTGYTDVDLFYVGGTVTFVYFQRGGWGDYYPLNSIYRLSPGDIIYFTYTGAPTYIYVVPR